MNFLHFPLIAGQKNSFVLEDGESLSHSQDWLTTQVQP